ncbi:polysaccharide deacetylase family protein [Streptomyces alkaliterrae]|uniref:Polysaccharide deacetylase family protein n=2 Tax=Streptomyces alkaliterrae TaxID=2213162 RepID=A0A7W3WY95_9ACTN|nr:polysaccharide deacetylase family protein [Streptomyces alkaliterrae]MBB1260732.1 polysaccharide deacetylase family protein [Streptomyces alkaliterrae]
MSRRRRSRVCRAVVSLAALVLVGSGVNSSAQAGGWPEAVPVVSRVETDEAVVFITVDDGWYRDAGARRVLLEERVPASLFLLPQAYEQEPGFFQGLLNGGPSRMENHTVNHPDLRELDAAGQRAELCGARDRNLAAVGDAPRLVRPPYGLYDERTLVAARQCGAKALVTWTHDFTGVGEREGETTELRAGDIVLLHFTPTLEADLRRTLEAARAAGLKPAQLRDHVGE